jgi:hypothetical protein
MAQWVCLKVWGPIQGSNIKNVLLTCDKIKLTIGFFFFFMVFKKKIFFFFILLHTMNIFFSFFIFLSSFSPQLPSFLMLSYLEWELI